MNSVATSLIVNDYAVGDGIVLLCSQLNTVISYIYKEMSEKAYQPIGDAC
jgi:hypothetical protein